MDALLKIEELMLQRNWTEYRLAKEPTYHNRQSRTYLRETISLP